MSRAEILVFFSFSSKKQYIIASHCSRRLEENFGPENKDGEANSRC